MTCGHRRQYRCSVTLTRPIPFGSVPTSCARASILLTAQLFEFSGTLWKSRTWHVNVEPRDALRNDGIQAFRRHRSDRRPDLQKQLATGASRPGLLEVPDDRLSDDGHERIDLGTSRLGAADRQTVVLPIDVVQAQRGDLTGPEAIDRQQQENRSVSDVRGVIGRRVLDQPSDCPPMRDRWAARRHDRYGDHAASRRVRRRTIRAAPRGG
jgi:hypothetical protein